MDDIIFNNNNKISVKRSDASKKRKQIGESSMDEITEEEIENEKEEWKRYIISKMNYNEDDVDIYENDMIE